MKQDPEAVHEAMMELRGYISELPEPFRTICEDLITDFRFAETYGSAGMHHAYPGGLAIHVYEVLKGALALAEEYPEADKVVLTVAAIFHDSMKMREYDPSVKGEGKYSDGTPVLFGKTKYSKLVRHVAGSHAAFMCALACYDPDTFPENWEDTVMKIEHCILAHHGRKEWGSPVEPQIVEAQILHFADMLSYEYGEGR